MGRAESVDDAESGRQRRLSDIAYERILESLFAQRVPAGAFVSQNELCALVDIPVAPLRDALRVLEAEGILTIHPRSGIQFVRPGLELTRATFQYRTILERAAVALFAERTADGELDALRARHAALAAAINRDGLSAPAQALMEELELALHHGIIASLQNELVSRSYARLHNYVRLLRLERRVTAPIILRTLREHLAVLDACQSRNAEAAQAALEDHLGAALQRSFGLT